MRLSVVVLLALLMSSCAIVPADGYGSKAGGNSVLVCHKGKKTLKLPRSAADAHINHGDRYGPC